MKIFIVYAHQEPKSFSGALLRGSVDTLTRAGHQVQVSDLYAMNFNPIASEADFKDRRFPDTLQYDREQKYACERHTFVELNEITDTLGASIGAEPGRLVVDLRVRCLVEDFAELTGLLVDVIRRPTFPASELEKVRGQTLTAIMQGGQFIKNELASAARASA